MHVVLPIFQNLVVKTCGFPVPVEKGYGNSFSETVQLYGSYRARHAWQRGWNLLHTHLHIQSSVVSDLLT